MIERIELHNFRTFELAALDFDEARTLILGPNGAGKSTIVDAIAWALTGRCRGVDGGGRGQKELIRNGAASMGVELQVRGLGLVSRSLAKDGNAVSNIKTDAILAHLGVTEAMLMAVLYGGTFFSMGHAEAKDMLMALLNVTVAPDQLPGLGLTEPAVLADLEARYQAATAARLAAKKALAAVSVPDAPKGKADERDLGVELHEATAAYQTKARALARAEQAIAAAERKIEAVDVTVATGPGIAAQLTVHDKMLTEAVTARDAAKADLAVYEADGGDDAATLQVQADELKHLAERLARHDTSRGCVLAASIPCLTDAKHFASHVVTLKKDAKTLAGKIKAALSRTEGLARLGQVVRTQEQQVVYHTTQIDKLKKALGDIEQEAAERPDLVAQLDQANADLAAADSGLALSKAAMDTLQAARQAQDQYARARLAHDAGKVAMAAAQADLAEQERLVSLLGPKGVRAAALDAALGDFLAMVNAALEPFGFGFGINVEPWRIVIERPGAGPLSFALLSAGEQLWCGLAFQIALAVVSGLRFTIVDAAEAVVGAHRQLITAMVLHAPVDQVIVAMARADSEPAPEIPGLQVIRLALQG